MSSYFLIYTDPYNVVYGSPTSFYLRSYSNTTQRNIEDAVRFTFPSAAVIYAPQITKKFEDEDKKLKSKNCATPRLIDGISVLNEEEWYTRNKHSQYVSYGEWLLNGLL